MLYEQSWWAVCSYPVLELGRFTRTPRLPWPSRVMDHSRLMVWQTSSAPHESYHLMITTLGQTIVMGDMTRSAIVPVAATAADKTESAPGLCVIASTPASPESYRTLVRTKCSPSCTRTGRVSRVMSIYGNMNGPSMVPASIRCHQSAIPTTELRKRSWITSRGL